MDVLVIGAGMGGMSAAIGLASRGARVTVLEANACVGGKLSTWQQDGFTFDTGPHVLTMRWALDEVFAQAGHQLNQHVKLIRLPSVCRYHFPNGDKFDAPADPRDAGEAIRRFSPGEEAGFQRFLAYARQVSDATTDAFLRQDFGAGIRGLPSSGQWQQLAGFLSLKPWRTLRDIVREHFHDPRLRQIFELYALYSGSHPARCSGIFATVADVQWREGTYYVEGGLYRIAAALQNVAEDLGVQLRMQSPVEQILVKGGRARGVVLQTGERLWADVVVCNADCLEALSNLVPARDRRSWTDKRIEKIEPSTSAFLLLLGIRGSYPQLAHHNSFLAPDPEEEYASIFDRGRPSMDPTIGVSCQSVTDPTRAPTGCSNLFVMTNPPALGQNGSIGFDWQQETPAYKEQILSKLETRGLGDLRERIIVEQIWTPQDLKARYGAYRGAIYGLSSNGWQQAFLRPPQISPDVRGLYFVGGSTHPGGGLPLCALSGTNVAKRIVKEV